MKKLSILFVLFIAFSAATMAQAHIEFDSISHNFGQVVEDGKIKHDFTFKNVGNTPLIISEVQTSCGCTTPNWTKTPIEPGQSGIITVEYNTKGRVYRFNRTVVVKSNAANDANVKLSILGEVIKKE